MKKIFLLLLAVVPAFLNGCGDEELKSIWNDNSIVETRQTGWGSLNIYPIRNLPLE